MYNITLYPHNTLKSKGSKKNAFTAMPQKDYFNNKKQKMQCIEDFVAWKNSMDIKGS